jgi:hypothetical protein
MKLSRSSVQYPMNRPKLKRDPSQSIDKSWSKKLRSWRGSSTTLPLARVDKIAQAEAMQADKVKGGGNAMRSLRCFAVLWCGRVMFQLTHIFLYCQESTTAITLSFTYFITFNVPSLCLHFSGISLITLLLLSANGFLTFFNQIAVF